MIIHLIMYLSLIFPKKSLFDAKKYIMSKDYYNFAKLIKVRIFWESQKIEKKNLTSFLFIYLVTSTQMRGF